MIAVNNFITELLDETITKDGTRVHLEAGSRPRIELNGSLETVPGTDIIELDELLYDLEALGITGISTDTESGVLPFRYQPGDTGKAIRFEISHSMNRGRLHVDMIKGQQPNDLLTDLLDNMERERASDLFLSGNNPPYYSVGGNTAPVPGYGPVSVTEILAELQDIGITLTDGQTKDFAYRTPVGANGESNRFRVNADFKNGRVSVVFRLIPTEIKPLVW